MNLFTVIGIVGVGMVIFTGLFALLVTRLDAAVIQNHEDMEAGKTRYRPANTMGFKIAQDADKTEQFLDARQEAAKAAARSTRGSNMRIGRKGAEHGKTTSDELAIDPISAFKIASIQGWKDLGEFAKAQASAIGGSAAPVAAAASGAKMVKRKLVPGKDFEVIEITAGMSGPERRTARATNGKAKYAAYKAAKASGADMAVAEVAPVAAAPAAAPSAGDQAAAAGIEEPVLIELTDDMDPAEKRAARIANSKAKSAYKKALKAAGIAPGAAPAAPPADAAPAAAPPPVVEEAPAGLDDIPKPDLIEMTDDMDPSEKRAARIANSKAKSAYKKALKEAGIDPKSVKI